MLCALPGVTENVHVFGGVLLIVQLVEQQSQEVCVCVCSVHG